MRRRILLEKKEETYDISLTYSSTTLNWWSVGSYSFISDVKVNGSYYSGDFTVRANQSWLKVGKSGSAVVIYNYQENPSTSSTRVAIITVSVLGQDLQITATQSKNTGRGTIGNYEWVDLDLPSGTKWATCNVGASKEYNPGYYYQYGKGANQYRNTSGGTIYTGTSNPLPSNVDTARQVMGYSWRMPTKAEFEELIANTTVSVETVTGTRCLKCMSKTNGNAYIFLPGGGFYKSGSKGNETTVHIWTSTPSTSDQAYWTSFKLYPNMTTVVVDNNRSFGANIRGVWS